MYFKTIKLYQKFQIMHSLNFHYFLLTRSVRDYEVYQRFGRQVMSGKRGNQFVKAFIDATEVQPSGAPGYLLVQTHPLYSRRDAVLFSHIMPDEAPLVLYRPV